MPVGLACAALGFFAARSLFGRVRRRLDAEAAGALPVYAEGAALAAAGASILFPPLAVLVLAGLAWLLAGGRRRAGREVRRAADPPLSPWRRRSSSSPSSTR